MQREATESRHREELHDRLERMVLDVEDVINSKENPEPQPVDTDLDRLYVLSCTSQWLQPINLVRSDSRKSSSLSWTNGNAERSSSNLSCA